MYLAVDRQEHITLFDLARVKRRAADQDTCHYAVRVQVHADRGLVCQQLRFDDRKVPCPDFRIDTCLDPVDQLFAFHAHRVRTRRLPCDQLRRLRRRLPQSVLLHLVLQASELLSNLAASRALERQRRFRVCLARRASQQRRVKAIAFVEGGIQAVLRGPEALLCRFKLALQHAHGVCIPLCRCGGGVSRPAFPGVESTCEIMLESPYGLALALE